MESGTVTFRTLKPRFAGVGFTTGIGSDLRLLCLTYGSIIGFFGSLRLSHLDQCGPESQ